MQQCLQPNCSPHSPFSRTPSLQKQPWGAGKLMSPQSWTLQLCVRCCSDCGNLCSVMRHVYAASNWQVHSKCVVGVPCCCTLGHVSSVCFPNHTHHQELKLQEEDVQLLPTELQALVAQVPDSMTSHAKAHNKYAFSAPPCCTDMQSTAS